MKRIIIFIVFILIGFQGYSQNPSKLSPDECEYCIHGELSSTGACIPYNTDYEDHVLKIGYKILSDPNIDPNSIPNNQFTMFTGVEGPIENIKVYKFHVGTTVAIRLFPEFGSSGYWLKRRKHFFDTSVGYTTGFAEWLSASNGEDIRSFKFTIDEGGMYEINGTVHGTHGLPASALLVYICVDYPVNPKIEERVISVCKNTNYTINIENTPMHQVSGEFHWYTGSTGQTIALDKNGQPGVGLSFTTPPIKENTTYFIKGVKVINGVRLESRATKVEIRPYDKDEPQLFFDVENACEAYSYNFINNTQPNGVERIKYIWDFDDGGQKIEEELVPPTTPTNPSYYYTTSGAKKVTVTTEYYYEDCGWLRHPIIKEFSLNVPILDSEEEQKVNFSTYNFKNGPTDNNYILSIGAASFSDSWVLDANSVDAQGDHAFHTGYRGVWRGNRSFGYLGERYGADDHLNTPLNIAWEGGFNPNVFNWKAASDIKPANNWVQANEMTRYSATGYELENKNVLDLYSAALYGYQGQLPTAVGANTSYYEFAFTGFEDESTGNFQLPLQGINNTIPVSREAITRKLKFIQIIGATDHLAILDIPFEEFNTMNFDPTSIGSDAIVRGVPFNDATKPFTINHVQLQCRYPFHDNADRSLTTLKGIGFEGVGDWQGELAYYANIKVLTTPLISQAAISDEESHTGKYSMKLQANLSMEQAHLELQADKKYVFSAWVKVGNMANVGTYQTENPTSDGDKLGVSLQTMVADGTGVMSLEPVVTLEPKGLIIEGWQRIEGVYVIPEGSEEYPLTIVFQTGEASTVYFDDIRFFPSEGNMQSYVYDPTNYRVTATLDNNNFATLYYYDEEGNLYLTKKETTRGIKTIQESVSHAKVTGN